MPIAVRRERSLYKSSILVVVCALLIPHGSNKIISYLSINSSLFICVCICTCAFNELFSLPYVLTNQSRSRANGH